MNVVRRQLTLFLTEQNQIIEEIRATYNPKQFELIKAHVTLCREDEIEDNLEEIIRNCFWGNISGRNIPQNIFRKSIFCRTSKCTFKKGHFSRRRLRKSA